MTDPKEIPKPSPRSIALRRISAREQSSLELIRYLERKGVSPEEAEATVQELFEEGLISDERYARALARDQSFKDKGPRHVMNLLRHKGVRIQLSEARSLMREVTNSEEEVKIRSILERRYPKAAQDKREKQRAFQALLRRGFSPDLITKTIRALGKDSQDSDES